MTDIEHVDVWACDGPVPRGKPCGTYLITPRGKDFDWTCPIHARNTDLLFIGPMPLPRAITTAEKEARKP